MFAAVAVLGALLVIGQRNPIYSVLALIVSFFGLSGLYILHRELKRAAERRNQ